MAELVDSLFRGDSWDFPGMQTTQILHTHSEDCSAESPVQAKVEEQSALRTHTSIAKATPLRESDRSHTAAGQTAPKGLGFKSLPLTSEPPAATDTLAGSVPMNLTFSGSSNSSNCCIPSISPQNAMSYDINASARIAEQLPGSTSPFPHPGPALQLHQAGITNGRNQPQLSAAHAARLHQFMASVFDDVDSGRIQHAGMSSSHFPTSLPHSNQSILQHNSLSPEMQGFFPHMPQPSQQQLQTQFLAQQLLEQHQQQDDAEQQQQQQQQQEHQQQQQQQHQQPPEQQQQLPSPRNAKRGKAQHGAQHKVPAAARWQHPLASAAASEQSRKPAKQNRSRSLAQHQLDDLDLSGLKRDFSSFSTPSSQAKAGRQAATRRAASFTHGSAASVGTTSPASTARKFRGAASSSQAAASANHVASPLKSMPSLLDSDVSVSEAEGLSGAEEADGVMKRQKVVKGRRGARLARRMLCKNCGAHQTPQWRCGPDGPRTLCNACGVRYKKGLPLTGPARSTDLV